MAKWMRFGLIFEQPHPKNFGTTRTLPEVSPRAITRDDAIPHVEIGP